MGRRGFDIKAVFGARVRELRIAAGLNQETLAETTGIFRTYLSNVERGTANPSLLVIKALADALGVPVVALFAPSAKDLPETAERTSAAATKKTRSLPPGKAATVSAAGKTRAATAGSRGRVR